MSPEWLPTFATASFGLVVGSFLNVVIARVPRKLSVVTPASHCPACKAKIAWYDNIPVLSYAVLLGRCRHCHVRISPRYPMIELLTAVLFVAARVKFGFSPLLFIRDFPFIAILVAVTFIDLEHRIIPDPLSLGGLALGLATCWFDPRIGILQALVGAAIGFGVFYGLAWAYLKKSGRSGLGGGDIKLLAMLGAWLGLEGVFTVILVSSVLGTVVGLAAALASRKKALMTFSIPYGPFLVVGGLYFYLLGDVLWSPFTNPM